MVPADRAMVGQIVAAAFAGKYGPALDDNPALAAELAAILPPGGQGYVGERAGVICGAGLLRFAGQPDQGLAEIAAIWRSLRRYQSLPQAVRSLWRLSLLEAPALPDRQSGYISSLAVAPSWQGHGLGGALLAQMELAARAAGKRQLALHVVDSNHAARRLYERVGFQVIRSEPAFFTQQRWGYGALLYMVKRLN
ncbi:MAG TPA: GNAT family N-acetyltransferase [Chloroflexia bacterium]|nr:GNAT family N-acetyltransferase [Chloroflexia bacterium]